MTNPGVFVEDETATLRTVILGIADSPGPPSGINERSKEAIKNDTYPSEDKLIPCLAAFAQVLADAGIEVLRPKNRPDLLQIFTRDIGFVVGSVFIKGRMKEPTRVEEFSLVEHHIRARANVVVTPPDSVTIEGGDIVLLKDTILVGVGRRTNQSAVAFLQDLFPARTVVGLDLLHDGQGVHESVLHLDCVFAPIGTDSALIFPAGFKKGPGPLNDMFPSEKRIELTADDLYTLSCNVLSIAPGHVVSCDTFTPLNQELKARGFTVSTVPFADVCTLGGLLRCSTLPLCRGGPGGCN